MLSTWEMLTLALLALLVFGPDRLPGMARNIGRTVSKLKTEANSTLDELRRASDIDELRKSADVSELRDAAAQLRAEADAMGQAADEATAEATTAVTDRPAPPYDPDAT